MKRFANGTDRTGITVSRGGIRACMEASPTADFGDSTMQIFVKGDRTVTVMVNPRWTAEAVVVAAAGKLGIPATDLYLTFSGKSLAPDTTLAEAGVQDGHTLFIRLRVIAFKAEYDEEVRRVLKTHLVGLDAESGPLFVFIGIGSHHSGTDAEKVRRQQCPEAILDLCRKTGLKLRILLVDVGFESEGGTQIYDLDPGRWRPEESAADGKVRRYVYAGSDCDATVTVYGTNVTSGEYAGTQKTLAGCNLVKLGALLFSKGSYFVAGNFYDTGATAHVALGPGQVLTTLGYHT